jgi:hypothetical protein
VDGAVAPVERKAGCGVGAVRACTGLCKGSRDGAVEEFDGVGTVEEFDGVGAVEEFDGVGAVETLPEAARSCLQGERVEKRVMQKATVKENTHTETHTKRSLHSCTHTHTHTHTHANTLTHTRKYTLTHLGELSALRQPLRAHVESFLFHAGRPPGEKVLKCSPAGAGWQRGEGCLLGQHRRENAIEFTAIRVDIAVSLVRLRERSS